MTFAFKFSTNQQHRPTLLAYSFTPLALTLSATEAKISKNLFSSASVIACVNTYFSSSPLPAWTKSCILRLGEKSYSHAVSLGIAIELDNPLFKLINCGGLGRDQLF